jgi:hypothetical protein
MSIADVLVVDDDIAICRILHRMLSDEQCKVQTSQSVADALGAIEQKALDAYVVDFKLPDGLPRQGSTQIIIGRPASLSDGAHRTLLDSILAASGEAPGIMNSWGAELTTGFPVPLIDRLPSYDTKQADLVHPTATIRR